MTNVKAFKALSLLATISLLVVTACTIQLRGGENSPLAPKAEHTTDATGSDLVRCRGVTPEETADYRHCKRIWDENRRRFIGKKDSAAASGHNDPTGSIPVPKDQSRLPQGYPNLTTPEASKP